MPPHAHAPSQPSHLSHPCLPAHLPSPPFPPVPSLLAHPLPELADFQTDAAKQEGLKQAIVASLNLPNSFTSDNVQLDVLSVTQRQIGPGRKLQVRGDGGG
jgi:hypothetical protein